eukprot:TRINITY_DN1919_c2_g1_i2.p1 TRINITY_DN1919_c2_g1~~TRINITY_DN1919_c2_g1_i2.p1  ORF type:complete len:204 (+),score=61.03 TRINITY_DN1919_c2_g1_i2:56-667(+)
MDIECAFILQQSAQNKIDIFRVLGAGHHVFLDDYSRFNRIMKQVLLGPGDEPALGGPYQPFTSYERFVNEIEDDEDQSFDFATWGGTMDLQQQQQQQNKYVEIGWPSSATTNSSDSNLSNSVSSSDDEESAEPGDKKQKAKRKDKKGKSRQLKQSRSSEALVTQQHHQSDGKNHDDPQSETQKAGSFLGNNSASSASDETPTW